MSLKNFPYEFSDNYKKLYDLLMNNPDHFILAMSDDKFNHIFKLRKILDDNIIGICDWFNYRKITNTFKEFENTCKKLNLKWILPERMLK
jgi:hypothetical protein